MAINLMKKVDLTKKPAVKVETNKKVNLAKGIDLFKYNK